MARQLGPLLFLLCLGLNAEAAAQDQFAVATGFGTVVRVFRITASEEISLHQTLILADPSEQVEVDSGGRFVFLANESDTKLNPIYSIDQNHELHLASTFTAPDESWDIAGVGTRLVPDRDSLLVYTASPENLLRVELHEATVNNRLGVRYVGDYLDLTGSPADSPSDGVASSFDSYSLLVSVADSSHAQIFRLDPSGALSLTDQSYSTEVTAFARPSRDGTGRLIAFNQQYGHDLGIGRFTGDGLSTFMIADVIDIPDFDDSINTAMHPSGRWAFVSGSTGVVSVELNDDGEFVRVVGDPAAGGGTSMAISADGRFLLTGAGAGLIRVNADGSLTTLSTGVPGVPSLSDIAWIPPRTLPSLPGDVNVDGEVDAADVVIVINEALPDDEPILPPQNFANADLDGDIDVDQDDLAALIDLLLGL
ncbi:hypothetical protein JXA47_10260 [Candidatus Sumerlaeota bacterium]|nr:hypothetical protein [Candidatus Sumerlaeota bacterium]